ncbi:MAG: hypothetical protein KatS3mg077_2245 [Candidatus Binatia bacterium]|nr:MAG: hypothetical protein KatS3mg077_2245 [Candidatus Binatia bacterium]
MLRNLGQRRLQPWTATVADRHLGVSARLAKAVPQAEEL